jgi:hypothetical protein
MIFQQNGSAFYEQNFSQQNSSTFSQQNGSTFLAMKQDYFLPSSMNIQRRTRPDFLPSEEFEVWTKVPVSKGTLSSEKSQSLIETKTDLSFSISMKPGSI